MKVNLTLFEAKLIQHALRAYASKCEVIAGFEGNCEDTRENFGHKGLRARGLEDTFTTLLEKESSK